MKVRKTSFLLICLLVICCGLSGAWLNAQTWTQYGPVPRFSHIGVYDSTTKQTIVFGGQNPATGTDLNDLWLVSTGTDKHITATSLTATGVAPSARHGHAAIYDPNRNNMTIFGTVPLIHEGKQIGAVDNGMEIGKAFVDSVKARS